MNRAGLLLALLLTACSAPAPPAPPAAESDSGPALEPPLLDPGALDQVSAIAVTERSIFLGGEAGILRLDPLSGAYRLMPEAEGLSSAGVSALALGSDATLWSAHRKDPEGDDDPAGGVRAFLPGQGLPAAWLVGEDVAALAVSDRRVVAAVGPALAGRSLVEPAADFVRFFEKPNRRMQVVRFDEEGAVLRRVIEFAPRGERVLALALAEPVLWIGTTHGLYRLGEADELLRYEIPCRVENRPPRRINALAATPTGVVAVLGLDTDAGEWRPGGVLELEGDAGWRCHVPDIDVPDSTALGVAHAAGRTWLATYEGLTRLEGADAELLDHAAGAPDLPASAVAIAADASPWVGTWGGGAWRLEGQRWVSYRFSGQPDGTAAIVRGELLSD